jgi:peptidoglycan/LPS O-acetylase OafA/YrhL
VVGTSHDRVSDRGADRESALDGLRAIAVIGVLLYHAGVNGFAGGSVGVDLFFVLSGFLITRLLLREHARSGRISLGRFWERRARRLLPALGVLLLGVAALSHWAPNGQSPTQLRGDSLSTLFYFANWHFVVSDQGYFAANGAKSPLLHTWSLGVEEQFYLIWPLVVVATFGGLLWWRRSRRHQAGSDQAEGRDQAARRLVWVAGAGTVASALLMAWMHLAGYSANRLYYGTDTRAQALLAGATLAALLVAHPAWLERGRTGVARSATVAAGWVGAAGVAWALHAFTEQSPSGYLGVFLAVAVAGAVLVGSVTVCPDSLLARLLSWPPLVGIGRISYGLYLYHWPIFLWLTTPRTGLSGAALLAVRLALTFAVSLASYYLIERPVRTRTALPRRWAAIALPSCTAVTVVAIVAATSVGTPSQTQVSASGARLLRNEVPAVAPPGPPVRTIFVGDSIGLTLEFGLGAQSAQWGVGFDALADLGCDLDPQTTTNVQGIVSKATQGCPDWRTAWPQQVQTYKPEAALVVLGRWEIADRLYQGKWVTVGDPVWDHHLINELDQVIDILSAGGAHVEMATLPYSVGASTQPDGQPWDINLDSRVNAYNADLRTAVRLRPTKASVLPLNRYLDPNGHYTDSIDGITVRWSDKEHISIPGGEYLRPYILPELRQAGTHAPAYLTSP